VVLLEGIWPLYSHPRLELAEANLLIVYARAYEPMLKATHLLGQPKTRVSNFNHLRLGWTHSSLGTEP